MSGLSDALEDKLVSQVFADTEKPVQRASWIGAPQAFDLNQACLPIAHAFGHCVYLVGSALKRRDYRDVDVRVLLQDEAYDRLFPGITEAQQHHPLWSVLCASISLWLSQHSGLPVDFQIQRVSHANRDYPKQPRHALGFFHWTPLDEATEPGGEVKP